MKAFAGSGEVEDGRIGIEDIICITASMIDQVCAFPHCTYAKNLSQKVNADANRV
jgi:hypothetical protein